MHPLLFSRLRNGNAMYDHYNEPFNGAIPDINEACSFLLVEEVHVKIESVLKVSMVHLKISYIYSCNVSGKTESTFAQFTSQTITTLFSL